MLGQVGGSAPHHGKDQLVQGPVVVDALDSTSWRSRHAPDFGLEPILSTISQGEVLEFNVSCNFAGEVPKLPNVWKTIVKNVSKDQNVCIHITRRSRNSQSTVVLCFCAESVVQEENFVVFMQEFANVVRSNQRVESLHIQTRFIRSRDRTLDPHFRTPLMNMIVVILESPSLQSVFLDNRGPSVFPLDRAAVESLVSALRRNLTLNCFKIDSFRDTAFDTEELKLFLEPLRIRGERSYQGLKTLHLEYAAINDERAQVVASMLRHNASLTCISLRYNSIGPQGAARIAKALRSNTTLQKLDMSHNFIRAAGLKALVASLTHNMADSDLQPNTSLTHLGIAGYLHDMADGDLQPNTSLTHLGIARYLGKEAMEPLETLVRQNASLLRLDLTNSSLLQVADNVIRLLEALKSNKCLEEVLLQACDGVVGRRVLGTIFDLLDVNHHLKNLNMDNTSLAADGGAEMVEAVLEQKAKHNVWEVLQAMATARPNSARIFLCGYPLAGERMNPISGSKTPPASLSRPIKPLRNLLSLLFVSTILFEE